MSAVRSNHRSRISNHRTARGFTYLEMVATAGILAILASAVLPLARVTRTREKEIELRREEFTLRGSGRISFGHAYAEDPAETVEFETAV